MTWFVLAVLGIAVGVVRLHRLAVPPRTDLVAAVGNWDQARVRATRLASLTHKNDSRFGRVARRLVDELDRRGRDLTRLREDVAVVGTTLEAHLAKSLVLAVIGLIAPPAIFGTLLAASGLHVPPGLAVLIGLGLAAAMLLATHQELATSAIKRRAELRRTLSIYLDLVAMSLEAGRGHSEALPAAANVGTGWTFTLLQDAIAGARYSGVTPWAALGSLGRDLGMPELSDLESALRLAADDGAKVRATLVARAATLRAARIADAEAEADRATESMRFTLIVMVFAFLAYELYPAVVRLFTG